MGGFFGKFSKSILALKSFTLDDPGASEDVGLFFTDIPLTIKKLVCVLNGSDTPSVTWTLRHDTDRSATGTEVVTSGTVTTSTTTGSVITVFNAGIIPANSFVFFETTAKSGTVDQLLLSVIL